VPHILEFGDASKSPAEDATSPNSGICETVGSFYHSEKHTISKLGFENDE
jgi:hypothetical protein